MHDRALMTDPSSDRIGRVACRRSLASLLVAALITLGATMTAGAATEEPAGSPLADPGAAVTEAAPTPAATERPEWFGLEMTDVQTGETFTVEDFAGKVVLLESMAVWCPTCQRQGDEVAQLHELLGHPEDLVSVSLDVDMGEDDALLKDYVETLGYDWRFAVAPLLVARALGNLYSAQYLNPPVSPMLIIDRDGQVLGLPFGEVKSAQALQQVIEPLLDG